MLQGLPVGKFPIVELVVEEVNHPVGQIAAVGLASVFER